MSDLTEEPATKLDGAADPDGATETVAPSPREPRNRWLTWGVPALVVILVVLAGTGFWHYSPWERLSGTSGTPPRTPSGAPVSGAHRLRDVTDPVLVAGAVLDRHGGGVRAVDLADDTTWWSLSRPGRVKVDSIGRVDGQHAAIVWTDGRLTVVDVASGRRVHVDLPDLSAPGVVKDNPWNPTDPTVGLADPSGRPFVAVVQPRGVNTYDASSGRLLWARPAPANCVFNEPYAAGQQEGSFLSLDVNCKSDPIFDDSYTANAYSMLLDASSGQPLPHFDHFTYGSLVPVGDHELLQDAIENRVDTGYRVVDSRTGGVLWTIDPGAGSVGIPQVDGGAGLVVVNDTRHRGFTVYRAADGKQLWQYTVTSDAVPAGPAQVIAGQVRLVSGALGSVKVTTFDSTGKVLGDQDLAMFDRGGNPRLVGGDYATLVIEDLTTELFDYPDPPYVLLTTAG